MCTFITILLSQRYFSLQGCINSYMLYLLIYLIYINASAKSQSEGKCNEFKSTNR
jgi:hypothetical protein